MPEGPSKILVQTTFYFTCQNGEGHSSPCLPFLLSSDALPVTGCMEEIDGVPISRTPHVLTV